MRQRAVMAALAVGVSVMSVAAQGRNFSGTWVIDAEKTRAAAPAAGGGGGGGGAMVARAGGTGGSTDTVITLDATTFAIEVAGVKTSYPTNGTETSVDVRGVSGRATARWQGDVLTITTTIDGANGPVTSSQSWFLEGESLVRETTRKMYYTRK